LPLSPPPPPKPPVPPAAAKLPPPPPKAAGTTSFPGAATAAAEYVAVGAAACTAVDALGALAVLEKTSPEAAAWWRDNVPRAFTGRRRFLFASEVWQVVE
jgi:hypothetical protein